MRIKIDLSKKSIENAIKKIKEVQKKVQKDLPRVYLEKCVEFIKFNANANLKSHYISLDIVEKIEKSWTTEYVSNNYIRLANTEDTATYLEFGVGIVGQENKHSVSASAGYKYNIPTKYKKEDGSWRFYLEESESVDLNVGTYNVSYTQNGKKKVITKGSPANMYLFKAMKSFETSGAYKTLWEQAKAEVIG